MKAFNAITAATVVGSCFVIAGQAKAKDAFWQKHLNTNPELKAWVIANPSLAKNAKLQCDEEFLPPTNYKCVEFAMAGMKYTYDMADTPELEKKRQACFNDPSKTWMKKGSCVDDAPLEELLGIKSKPSIYDKRCPPGEKYYRTNGLFGLGARDIGCMSPYEAEMLRTQQLKNIQDSFKTTPRTTIPEMKMPEITITRSINYSTNLIGRTTYTHCY